MTHVIKIHSDCIFFSLTTLMNLHFVFSQCIYSCVSVSTVYAKTTPTQKIHNNTSVVFSEFFPTSIAFCVLLQGLSICWLRCNSPAHRRNILKRYIR